MLQENGVVGVSAAVDYLTVVTRSEKAAAQMIDTLYKAKGKDFWVNSVNKPWKFKGFHGRAYEGVRYGLRGEEAILMLSGPTASELWAQVAPTRARCTRIDLAVTVELAGECEHLAQQAFDVDAPSGPVNRSLVLNSRGGSTMYVGSRQSMYMGRLYDKSAEQGEKPGKVWRYEVEIKKPASESLLIQLLETPEPAQYINSYVYTWFLTRGIKPLWTAKDWEGAIEIEAKVESPDKSLAWLTSQVRPTVARLIIAGKELEVREALGLPLSTFTDEWRKVSNGSE